MDTKTYLELTDQEVRERAKLTPKEKAAVDAFIAAAKALPRRICVEVGDNYDGEGHLQISKRVTRGYCQGVASLRKSSLHF